jgi:hypothetical protein
MTIVEVFCYLASAGSVVNVSAGGDRRPRTLSEAPGGVSNSIVPRMFAVVGKSVVSPCERWPLDAIGIVAAAT